MPSALRNPLTLFSFVLFGQLGVLLGSLGTDGLTPTHLLLALAISASITLLWEFVVQRSLRQGMARVEQRIGRLSAFPRKVAGPVLPAGDEYSRRLEYRLIARQHSIARYARQLRQELARFRSIYSHSHDAIMIFEPGDGRLVDSNPRAAEFLGVEPDQLKGARLFELHDEDEPYLRALIDDVMDSRQGRSLRINYRAGDGRMIPAEVSASRIELDTGSLLLCIARDVSEREDAEQRIQHLAYHDTLTNLPNRTLLTDRVNRALARARRT
ncbi:MAG: PAS domain S-box protein, partial [Gammaproteobacteria bacterium]|nr:PAS domain S-box protein [Gammaproteobacteria bacterium]